MATYQLDFSDPLKEGFPLAAGGFNGPGSGFPETSLRLYGEQALAWGESVNENFIRLLENFASASPPPNPNSGQVWVRQGLYWKDQSVADNLGWYYFNRSASPTWSPVSVTSYNTINDPATFTPTFPIASPSIGDYIVSDYGGNLRLYRFDRFYGQAAPEWILRDYNPEVGVPLYPANVPTQDVFVYNEFGATPGWNSISGTGISSGVSLPGAPSNPASLFYNTTNNTLYYWNGSAWTPVVSPSGNVAKSGDTMTGFLTLNANPVNPLHATPKQYVDSAIPSGVILMWSGSVASIPPGWALCDGTLGTPNLMNRFVFGATAITVGFSGGGGPTGSSGSHSHIINNSGPHTHVTTAVAHLPQHAHNFNIQWEGGGAISSTASALVEVRHGPYGYPSSNTDRGAGANSTSHAYLTVQPTGTNDAHSHSAIAPGSEHTHPVTAGGLHTHVQDLPPWYALAYIMKL